MTENEYKERVRKACQTNRNGLNVGNVVIAVPEQMWDVLVREGRGYV